VAAFFELTPIGTEGRESELACGRPRRRPLENALQDTASTNSRAPWVVQLYGPGRIADLTGYLKRIAGLHPAAAAQGARSGDFYLRFLRACTCGHHQPGGNCFDDHHRDRACPVGAARRGACAWWSYRRAPGASTIVAANRPNKPWQRCATGFGRRSRQCRRQGGGAWAAADIHAWLLRWFNPNPTLLGATAADRERFYQWPPTPKETNEGDVELASGT